MMDENSQIPVAEVSRKKSISLVWIVPLVAVLVGAGLVYTTLTEKGPTAVISFESAEGLEAGKTMVKYKDVNMGKVQSVRLTPGLERVQVTVDLAKEAKDYLTDQTRFWVVRPRLSGSTVSGLGTLLSGAYIAIEPSKAGEPQSEFKGLEIPPLVTRESQGRLFTLKADRLDSLDYGSPVYFRGMKVGQVTGYSLEESGDKVDIQVFIDAPHDRKVTDTAKFWSASGLDLDLGSEGVKINTQSFLSILLGGIVLYTPTAAKSTKPAKSGRVFTLFDSKEAAMARQYGHKAVFLLKFSQSVRGLDIGAPVEFRGLPVGQVADIGIEFDWKNGQVLVLVRIEIDVNRLQPHISKGNAPDEFQALELLVAQGMRGQLRTGNLLTGKLFVALDFFKNAEPATITHHGKILELPTTPAPLDVLANSLQTVLKKMEQLPVKEISTRMLAAVDSIKEAGNAVSALANSGDVKGAVKAFDLLMKKMQTLTQELNRDLPATVTQVRTTLAGVNEVVSKDAEVVTALYRALDEMSQAAKALRHLAEDIEQHPESLLRGKEKK